MLGVKRAVLGFRSWARVAVCACVALCFAPAAVLAQATPPAAPPQAGGLFNSEEIRSENRDAFTKWADMLSRHAWNEGRQQSRLPCRAEGVFKCRRDRWRDLLERLRGRPAREQVEEINSFFNDVRYVVDRTNWQMPDYWATIEEFLERDGDCEDYAIAKYFSLKMLGFDPALMRIAIVEDLNLETPHAILVIYLDDEVLVLDNQFQGTVNASSIVHYRPIYSINEEAWWLHRAAE